MNGELIELELLIREELERTKFGSKKDENNSYIYVYERFIELEKRLGHDYLSSKTNFYEMLNILDDLSISLRKAYQKIINDFFTASLEEAY